MFDLLFVEKMISVRRDEIHKAERKARLSQGVDLNVTGLVLIFASSAPGEPAN